MREGSQEKMYWKEDHNATQQEIQNMLKEFQKKKDKRVFLEFWASKTYVLN